VCKKTCWFFFSKHCCCFLIFQINTAVGTALPAHLAVGPANGLGITSNKTGTLNTKAVTASQLATNSPILPHKIMNGNNMAPAPPSKTDISNGRVGPKGAPALPPRGVSIRSRDSSMNRNDQGMGMKPPPPAVPPKRSSLTRSDLALFSAENVSYPCLKFIYSEKAIENWWNLQILFEIT
jgi:hypothetical protein